MRARPIASTLIGLFNIAIALITGKRYIDINFAIVNVLLLFVSCGFTRFFPRILRLFKKGSLRKIGINNPVMIIGAGDAGSMIIKDMIFSDKTQKTPVCIIDDDKKKHRATIYGVPVVGGQPHRLQHARLPCPSLSPGVCSNLRSLSR